eukprot:COSAG06_NODE_5640_length_3345_cov_1.609057_1_plen_777_part_10
MRRALAALALAAGQPRAARACERQHGVAVKTWLADDVSCAPVADFVYARVEAHECPIQHYDSTPDVASIQACAWACDSQLSCVGFAWGIPSNAVAPLRPCALTETCDAASAYLRPAADQRRSSYFKIPRERPFAAGAAAPTAAAVEGTVLSLESTGLFSAESTSGEIYRADDTPSDGECTVDSSEQLEEVRLQLSDGPISARSVEEAACLRQCADHSGATGCLTHSTDGCFVYTSTTIARIDRRHNQPAQRCFVFWRSDALGGDATARVFQVSGELRAPASGSYGFQLSSDDDSLLTALRVTKSPQQHEDPCAGEVRLVGGGRIHFGNYEEGMQCRWVAECPAGYATVVFTFFELDSSRRDNVYVDNMQFAGNSYNAAFGSAELRGGELASFTGGAEMVIRFESRNQGAGFSADVTCSGEGLLYDTPPPPPGCGQTPMLEGKTGCDDDCAGLAYIADLGRCSGCSIGGTPITAGNVFFLDPPAVMCTPPPGGLPIVHDNVEQGELLLVTATVKQCPGPRSIEWVLFEQPSCAEGVAEAVDGAELRCEPIATADDCSKAGTMVGVDSVRQKLHTVSLPMSQLSFSSSQSSGGCDHGALNGEPKEAWCPAHAQPGSWFQLSPSPDSFPVGVAIKGRGGMRPASPQFVRTFTVSWAPASEIPDDAGDSGLLHAGEECWVPCGRVQGWCDYCGTGLCCNAAWQDTSGGCDGIIGGSRGHRCAAALGDEVDHSLPREYIMCGASACVYEGNTDAGHEETLVEVPFNAVPGASNLPSGSAVVR